MINTNLKAGSVGSADTSAINPKNEQKPSALQGAVPVNSTPLAVQRQPEKTSVSHDRADASVIPTKPLSDAQPSKTSREERSQQAGSAERKRQALSFSRPETKRQEKNFLLDTFHIDPKNWGFRKTTDLSRIPADIDLTGMDTLNISGSGAIFAKQQVKDIQNEIGDHPLVVIDLRKEPHVSLDDKPATWATALNFTNQHKSYERALQNEEKRINRLSANSENVQLVDQIDFEHRRETPKTYTLNQPTIKSEQQVVESCGAQYVRLGVADHMRPEDIEVDRYLQKLNELPDNSWLHFHCRGGIARTLVFMVMHDMLHNAKSVPLGDIVERQRTLDRDYDLMSSGKSPLVKTFRQDRREFLTAFYEYAKENPIGSKELWSDWCDKKLAAGIDIAPGFVRD